MTAKPIRSIMFAPANLEKLLRKMPAANADITIACLEDGTPVEEKVQGRKTATDTFRELKQGGWKGRAFVRINPLGTEFFEEDVVCAVDGPFDGLVIPKVGGPEDVLEVMERVKSRGDDFKLILGLESGRGIINIEAIMTTAKNAIGAYFGAEDFATSIGGVRSESNVEVAYARARVALHAKVHGLNAFDCGTIAIKDDERFRRECAEARGYGYTGKVCLHPRQVELANECFMPSAEEVAYYRRLLDAYNEALRDGRATPAIDGLMIDGPLVKRAEATLALAEA